MIARARSRRPRCSRSASWCAWPSSARPRSSDTANARGGRRPAWRRRVRRRRPDPARGRVHQGADQHQARDRHARRAPPGPRVRRRTGRASSAIETGGGSRVHAMTVLNVAGLLREAPGAVREVRPARPLPVAGPRRRAGRPAERHAPLPAHQSRHPGERSRRPGAPHLRALPGGLRRVGPIRISEEFLPSIDTRNGCGGGARRRCVEALLIDDHHEIDLTPVIREELRWRSRCTRSAGRTAPASARVRRQAGRRPRCARHRRDRPAAGRAGPPAGPGQPTGYTAAFPTEKHQESRVGVPKRKVSKARQGERRAHLAISAPPLVECSHCHELKRAPRLPDLRLLRRPRGGAGGGERPGRGRSALTPGR